MLLSAKKNQFNQLTFSEKVVLLVGLVPKGKVVTYGDLARAAGGGPMVAQSITAILGKAKLNGEMNIPFHRIVYADGRVWLDDDCRESRLNRYKREKIAIDSKDRVVNFAEKRFDFRTIDWEVLQRILRKNRD